MTTSAASRVEVWVWVLIYGGLLLLGLGLSAQRSDTAIGWVLIVAGVIATGAGAVLVWVRSRMNPSKEANK
ncbi:MAG TPA: hypothetical protein VJO99_03155 [Burkholderiaceae bacterium]|nr:hypothetical protein [Burkholderiaceae bacterium]